MCAVRDRLSDAVNRRIAVAQRRYTWRDRDTADIDCALTGTAEPDDVFWYLASLFLGWLYLGIALEFVFIPIAYLATTIFGDRGNHLTVRALTFCGTFCVLGAADALWRYYVVMAARRRYRRLGAEDDPGTHRLLGVARFPTATVIVQIVVATLLARAA